MGKNLWLEVAVKCLEKACALLDSEKYTTADSAEIANTLVKTALEIDEADHKWKSMEWAALPSDRMLLGLEKMASK